MILKWLNVLTYAYHHQELHLLLLLLHIILEYDQLLILRVDGKSHGELSEDHKCAISQLVNSLEKLSIFHCVEDFLKSCKYRNCSHFCESLIKVVQEPSVINNYCCQKKEIKDLTSTFPEVKPSHFVAMNLLSWPYEILGSSESAEVTHAAFFSQYIKQDMSEASEILKSEIDLLKNQFETVFSRKHWKNLKPHHGRTFC